MHGAFSHQFATRPTVAAVVESHKLVTKLLHDALDGRRPLDDAGIPQKDCPRRNGSRTPRSKVRVAVSPEKRHEHAVHSKWDSGSTRTATESVGPVCQGSLLMGVIFKPVLSAPLRHLLRGQSQEW